MSEFFGYDVTFVMNITDIDDKIILNARKEFLVKEYRSKNHASFVSDVTAAWKQFVQSKFAKLGYTEGEWDSFLKRYKDGEFSTEEDPKLGLYVNSSLDCLHAIEQKDSLSEDELYAKCHDILASYLDSKFGDTVTDPAIYKDFAQYWEHDYFKDMKALNVLPPDMLTRVSEYVPEIVDYVNKIIENGYAYEADGSVYFDTRKFHEDHVYAKLAPWNANNLKLMQEGEGDLSVDTNKKKHASDFALWKKSKRGEPFWDSPWGQGRPGWHIECSVMASHVLGEQMDIHGGGIDLTFPHHDNELAQSEVI
jgi:cysteinyl-tRNA synthetase